MESVSKRHRTKAGYFAKDDADLCYSWQEEYHRIKLSQMKELHALEVEHMKVKTETIQHTRRLMDDVYSQLTSALASAKRAYDALIYRGLYFGWLLTCF